MGALVQLFEETIRRHIEPSAAVAGYEPVPTPERERDYGTAAVQRYAVRYDDHAGRRATVTLFIKDAPVVERRVLELFNQLRQVGVPYSHTLDTATDGPVPVCQQDLAPDEGPPGEVVIRAAADRLARIHLANAGCADGLTWLPWADRAYFEGGYVLGTCWEQWAETMRIERFAREWGHKRSWLEAAAGRFLADMDRLWAEGDSLTLVHADLHRDHIIVHDGEPYVIDWGQARYGSFYLDLPNYFTPEEAELYREALAVHGRVISHGRFRERYDMARRYVAFKYLGYTMWAYRNGGTTLDEGQWDLFETAVEGIDNPRSAGTRTHVIPNAAREP